MESSKGYEIAQVKSSFLHLVFITGNRPLVRPYSHKAEANVKVNNFFEVCHQLVKSLHRITTSAFIHNVAVAIATT